MNRFFSAATIFSAVSSGIMATAVAGTMAVGQPAASHGMTPRTAGVAGLPVGHQELRHFAAALKSIQPINVKAEKMLENKTLSTRKKHDRLVQYGVQVKTILTKNHLTPAKYETLLKKAQTDPHFVARTEKAMHKSG